MKRKDIPVLIEMCSEALVELDKYEATNDSGQVFNKIRAIGNACIEGDQLDPFLKEHVSLKQQYAFKQALYGLRTIVSLSAGRGSNPKVRNNIGFVKNVLENIMEKEVLQQKETLNVFYSWQANLPNKTNRGFIRECLEKSLKLINKETNIKTRLEADTSGVPGSPDIIHTILNKIDKSDIFIADVSIVNDFAPNPNVMLELGYALKTLGDSKILMIFNSAFGKPQNLPFDLGFKRQIMYKLTEADDKSIEKKGLTNRLKKALEKIIETL
jgi:hypothetical protein